MESFFEDLCRNRTNDPEPANKKSPRRSDRLTLYFILFLIESGHYSNGLSIQNPGNKYTDSNYQYNGRTGSVKDDVLFIRLKTDGSYGCRPKKKP
jgi:hypothetical protein